MSFLVFKLDNLSSDCFAFVKFQVKTSINTVIYSGLMIVKDKMPFYTNYNYHIMSPESIYSKWWLLIKTKNRGPSLEELLSTLPGCPVCHKLWVATLSLTKSCSEWLPVSTYMMSSAFIIILNPYLVDDELLACEQFSPPEESRFPAHHRSKSSLSSSYLALDHNFSKKHWEKNITLQRGNFCFPRGINSQSDWWWCLSINRGWWRQLDVFGCLPEIGKREW